MSPDRVRVGAVLDEAADLVARRVPEWAGLAVVAALPLRFVQAHFANRLLELGAAAATHGRYLLALSWCVTLAMLPALWGRAVLARAVALALAGGAAGPLPGRAPLRLPASGLAAYLYVALVVDLLAAALGWTVALLPVFLLLSGLAAATSPLQTRAGPWAPLRVVLAHLRQPRLLAGLLLAFAAGFVVAFANLLVAFGIGLWAAGATGADLSWWRAAISPGNRQFALLVAAGAVLALEPFWVAALSVAVHRMRARESGEDLAAWLEELRREAAA